jgi:hypothetical protein
MSRARTVIILFFVVITIFVTLKKIDAEDFRTHIKIVIQLAKQDFHPGERMCQPRRNC